MKKFIIFLPFILVLLTACPKKDVDMPPAKQDRKIGYLFYTSFIDGFNGSLFQAFNRFKEAGVTDLIVDLRYNHGGSVAAAGYLASLIAPTGVVQSGTSVFTQLDFNAFLNNYFGNSRKYFLGESAGGAPNPLGANLNLKNVYIIATDDSYSAAELLTFCLRPYVNVVHVGSQTGGKFTASVTVTAYDNYSNRTNTIYNANNLSAGAKDSLNNWGMQPIVAIYKNSANADFSVPGTLNPDVAVTSRENDASAYLSIGDPSDYLLAATISKILGTPISASQSTTVPRSVVGLQAAKLFTPMEDISKESVRWPKLNASTSGVTGTSAINTVSQFVYDGMDVWYKWVGASGYTLRTPTASDNDPASYFYSILHPLDTQNGWSWITDDVNALLAGFSGTPVAFGWALNYFWADAGRTKIVAIVKYVYPNTPAASAGIKRGAVISQVNGIDLTATPGDAGYYGKLSGNTAITITTNTGSLNLTPVTISTNPVLKDTIYTYSN